MQRRHFLSALAASCAGGAALSTLPKFAFAQTGGEERLVFVQLRGAMDGLATFVPHGDPAYQGTRGNLAFDRNDLIDLDGLFGLPPALAALKPAWDARQLLPFHAASIPVRTRSHFDAQYILETGLHSDAPSESGWLNRALSALGGSRTLGISLGQGIPVSLSGPAAITTWAPSRFDQAEDPVTAALAALYAQDSILGPRFQEAMDLDALVSEGMDMGMEQRGNNQAFTALMDAAGRFLAAEDGPRIAAVDLSGWDTHRSQGITTGILARQHTQLIEGLAALQAALGPTWDQTLVVVMTEFGRTAATNGSRGTDHGTGGAGFILGGALSGPRRVLTDWPGLATRDLYEGRDLRPTLDTRAILKGVLHDHMQVSNAALNDIFPQSDVAKTLSVLA